MRVQKTKKFDNVVDAYRVLLANKEIPIDNGRFAYLDENLDPRMHIGNPDLKNVRLFMSDLPKFTYIMQSDAPWFKIFDVDPNALVLVDVGGKMGVAKKRVGKRIVVYFGTESHEFIIDKVSPVSEARLRMYVESAKMIEG